MKMMKGEECIKAEAGSRWAVSQRSLSLSHVWIQTRRSRSHRTHGLLRGGQSGASVRGTQAAGTRRGARHSAEVGGGGLVREKHRKLVTFGLCLVRRWGDPRSRQFQQRPHSAGSGHLGKSPQLRASTTDRPGKGALRGR